MQMKGTAFIGISLHVLFWSKDERRGGLECGGVGCKGGFEHLWVVNSEDIRIDGFL